MKFKKVKFFTHKLEEQKAFYQDTLGFELIDETENLFSIKVGWTEFIFEKSIQEYIYHYCFLIPKNKLHEALTWFEDRVGVITIEGERKTQFFDTWNAESFYFKDRVGNLAECIIRNDLDNNSEATFDISQLLCVNEVGIPSKDIVFTNSFLEENLNTKLWKGDTHRFGANGDDEGIFLLPNTDIKNTWFPTYVKIQECPFEVVIENDSVDYFLNFEEGKLKVV